MKWIIAAIVFAGLVGLAFTIKKKVPIVHDTHVVGAYEPVAVLELFTSEGCSSCPPADRLLPELAKIDHNVFAVAYHVDYWNRYGWTDPFSSADYSQRQDGYAKRFKLEGVYTPELVVNGEVELVGSDQDKAAEAIKKALSEKALVNISISDVTKDGNKIKFNCGMEGDLGKSTLIAVLLQKQATVKVHAGENNGAELSHINIVRAFSQERASKSSTIKLRCAKRFVRRQLGAGGVYAGCVREDYGGGHVYAGSEVTNCLEL